MSYPQDIHRGELFTGVHKLSTGVSKGKVRGCIRVHSGTLRDHSGTLEDHSGITQGPHRATQCSADYVYIYMQKAI